MTETVDSIICELAPPPKRKPSSKPAPRSGSEHRRG
jgi:hypothetical protein